MDDDLSAVCPRHIRVRPSLQVAGQRVPAYGFLVVMGVGVIGLLGIICGARLETMLWLAGAGMLVGLLLVEGRWWGRSTPQAATILWRHARRPWRMRLAPMIIVLPAEAPATGISITRRLRWQTMEADDA